MLRIKSLNVYYDKAHVLKDVSLEVKQGEIVAVVGANGAGKSTLLKTVAGVVKPRDGSILFQDSEISSLKPEDIVRLGIGLVPEGRQIFNKLTVMENLEVGGYLHLTGRNRPRFEKAVGEVFKLFPRLKVRLRQRAGTMSGGEQQMLAIGRALMTSPKMIIMDEPTMGLAPLVISEILGVTGELAAAGTTILLVEQNVRAALKIAHRGYVMALGAVVHQGLKQELLAQQEILSAYLGTRTLKN